MKVLYTFLPVFCLLILYTNDLKSQKPRTVYSFEKPLELADEKSYLQGNKQISKTSGFPVAVFNPQVQLTPAEPETMAKKYLQLNKTVFGITEDQISELVLHAVRESPSGMTVRLRQHINEIPVGKSEFAIHLNHKNEVSFVTSSYKYGIELDNFNVNIDAQAAREIVGQEVKIRGEISAENQRLEIFKGDGPARLIHRVSFIGDQPAGEWEAFVDAQSGELIKLEDVSFYFHEHKEALKPGLPFMQSFTFVANGTGPAFNPDPLSTSGAAYGNTGYVDNSDVASTQLNGQTLNVTLLDIFFDGVNYNLAGPWTEIADFEAPFKGLFSQSSNNWNFDRSDDAFEATNTYYMIDQSMRYVNNVLGLNIVPTANSGVVAFDPHGLGGADNAHYLPSTQRVSFGEGGVDDGEDGGVILHELAHGLHDWVASGGLSQNQGLSEGSADYWAASYNRSLPSWNAANANSNWIFIWDGHNEFWPGRVVDYTPSYPGGIVGAIHTDGQIWATAMIKVWDAIGGFQSDKAFWEGLGMTANNSNQNVAANAVYQAAVDMGYSNATLISMHSALTSSGYTLPSAPLPVDLARFTGKKEEKSIILNWTTASQTNHDHFLIERSSNGRDFTAIGKESGEANTQSRSDYAFVDYKTLNGDNYYRLKMVDLDESFAYSNILHFRIHSDKVQIFPNPAKSVINIESETLFESDLAIHFIDAVGKTILSRNFQEVKNGSLQIDISELARGYYTLRIEGNNTNQSLKFLKN